MKPFTKLTSLLLAILALVHLYRLVQGIEIVFGGSVVPQWASIIGLLVTSLLSVMLWRESRA